MPATKVSLSLPTDVLEEAERRLARPHETRSGLVSRILADALRELDEREAEEQYVRGYLENPETEDEKALNRHLAQRVLARHDSW